ncbi:MAG: hypothetical protein JW900_12595 [Anaerolineae bacterium]|nr:hypothetical protein [Anaerolineae bacterium]
MTPTRREFIKRLGITLIGFAAGQHLFACRYADPDWETLRRCWAELNDHQYLIPYEGDQERLGSWGKAYRAALDNLVQRGRITQKVADHLEAAFRAAAGHINRTWIGGTCYMMDPVTLTSLKTGADLLQQTTLLEEMSASGALDTSTVALARTAIERDIAFLEGNYDWTALQDDSIEPDPDEIEAARILVRLMLGARP